MSVTRRAGPLGLVLYPSSGSDTRRAGTNCPVPIQLDAKAFPWYNSVAANPPPHHTTTRFGYKAITQLYTSCTPTTPRKAPSDGASDEPGYRAISMLCTQKAVSRAASDAASRTGDMPRCTLRDISVKKKTTTTRASGRELYLYPTPRKAPSDAALRGYRALKCPYTPKCQSFDIFRVSPRPTRPRGMSKL